MLDTRSVSLGPRLSSLLYDPGDLGDLVTSHTHVPATAATANGNSCEVGATHTALPHNGCDTTSSGDSNSSVYTTQPHAYHTHVSVLFPYHTIHVCGFVYHDRTTQLPHLPPNVALVEYGFQADYNFHSQCEKYVDAGVSFSVMCGSAAWNSLSGCPEAAMSNISYAVSTVRSLCGSALVLAHWSGIGHLTSHPITYPALIAAAGLSWNHRIHDDYMYANIAELIDHHILHDQLQTRSTVTTSDPAHSTKANPTATHPATTLAAAKLASTRMSGGGALRLGATRLGEVIINLGRAETYLLRCARRQPGSDQTSLPDDHGSVMYQLLTRPDHTQIHNITADCIQKVTKQIRQCQSIVNRYVAREEKAQNTVTVDVDSRQLRGCDLVVQELQYTMALMLTACRLCRCLLLAGTNPRYTSHSGYESVINVGITNLKPTQKTDIANRLISHMDTAERLWTSRFSEQNASHASGILTALLNKLVPGSHTKL